MKRIWVGAIALAVGMLLVRSAQAAPTETGETGLVTIPTTDVLAPWSPSVGVHLNGPAGNFNGNSEIELWRTQFTLGLGLLDDLEITAQIPFVQFERDVAGRRHTDAVGGIRLGLKYRLLDEKNDDWISAALLGGVVLGTGRSDLPAILDRNTAFGGETTYEVMGIVDKILWSNDTGQDARFTLNAGGLFFNSPNSFSRLNQSLQFQRRFNAPVATFDTPFEFGAGLQVPVWAAEHFEIQLLEEFRGNTGTIREVQGSLPTWFFTGMRLAASDGLALQGGVDFGLSGFLEPSRFIVSLSYAMPSPEAAPVPVSRVAAAPAPLPSVAALPPIAKRKLVLRGVNFDYDRATIRPDSAVILREAARTLNENPNVNVVVEGHTDAKGTDAYDQHLSIQRALAVREQLEKFGVKSTRMIVRGRGKTQPVASNDSEAGRAENRRVELLVQP